MHADAFLKKSLHMFSFRRGLALHTESHLAGLQQDYLRVGLHEGFKLWWVANSFLSVEDHVLMHFVVENKFSFVATGYTLIPVVADHKLIIL
eukprot:3629103-Pyramimonas_sp.AAC.1